MTQLTRKQQQLFNALSIVVGNAMYALTVVLFLMPSGLITGGATGIALAFNKVTGLPVSAVLFVVNVAMLLLGWWVLGRRFALNTMASTVLSPFFMALWERLLGNLVLTDDLVLNTVFAGFGIGISLGITIRAGASTGGMDIPPLVLNIMKCWKQSRKKKNLQPLLLIQRKQLLNNCVNIWLKYCRISIANVCMWLISRN